MNHGATTMSGVFHFVTAQSGEAPVHSPSPPSWTTTQEDVGPASKSWRQQMKQLALLCFETTAPIVCYVKLLGEQDCCAGDHESSRIAGSSSFLAALHQLLLGYEVTQTLWTKEERTQVLQLCCRADRQQKLGLQDRLVNDLSPELLWAYFQKRFALNVRFVVSLVDEAAFDNQSSSTATRSSPVLSDLASRYPGFRRCGPCFFGPPTTESLHETVSLVLRSIRFSVFCTPTSSATKPTEEGSQQQDGAPVPLLGAFLAPCEGEGPSQEGAGKASRTTLELLTFFYQSTLAECAYLRPLLNMDVFAHSIRLFMRLQKQRRERLRHFSAIYQSAAEKFRLACSQEAMFSKKLETELRPLLSDRSAECERLAEQLLSQESKFSIAEQTWKEERQRFRAWEAEAARLASECETELSDVLFPLNQAEQSLTLVTDEELLLLKQIRSPPGEVFRKSMEALCCLLDIKITDKKNKNGDEFWTSAVNFLISQISDEVGGTHQGDDHPQSFLLNSLPALARKSAGVDKTNISVSAKAKIERLVKDGELATERLSLFSSTSANSSMSAACKVCQAICVWVKALDGFLKTSAVVAPKHEAMEDASQRAAELR